MSIFADLNLDFESLEKTIKSIDRNDFFDEYEDGLYKVKIRNITAKMTKSGKPFFRITMEIVDGEYRNKTIRYDQYIKIENNTPNAFQVSLIKNFLESLDSEISIETKSLFVNFEDLFEEILDKVKDKEYSLDVVTKGSFRNFKVIIQTF